MSDQTPKEPAVTGELLKTPDSVSLATTTSLCPVAPDGGYGWVIVFASFLIHFICDGVSLSFGILYPDIQREFGASKGESAIVGSLFLALPQLAGPLASALTDKFGCRLMTIVGGLLSSLGFLLSMYAKDIPSLCITMGLISGVGLAFCFNTAIVAVTYYFDRRRALATGIAVCGGGMGTFVFPPLIDFLQSRYGWHGCLLVLSGILLNLVVCGALLKDLPWPQDTVEYKLKHFNRLTYQVLYLPYIEHNAKITKVNRSMIMFSQHRLCQSTSVAASRSVSLQELSVHRRNDTEHQFVPEERIATLSSDANTNGAGRLQVHFQTDCTSAPTLYPHHRLHITPRRNFFKKGTDGTSLSHRLLESGTKWLRDNLLLLRSGSFVLFLFSSALLSLAVDIPYVNLPEYATAYLSISDAKSASLVSIIGILNTVGMLACGWIADFARNSKLFTTISFYGVSCVACGLVVSLTPFLHTFTAFALCSGLYGFFISANYSLSSVVVVELMSVSDFTEGFGVNCLVEGLGTLCGPALAGYLYDWTGSYNATFIGGGVCPAISGLLVLSIDLFGFLSDRKKINQPLQEATLSD